jgi:hypothetical protein
MYLLACLIDTCLSRKFNLATENCFLPPNQSLSYSESRTILLIQRDVPFSRSILHDHRPTLLPALQAALTLFGCTL